jgi:hypothetical protein
VSMKDIQKRASEYLLWLWSYRICIVWEVISLNIGNSRNINQGVIFLPLGMYLTRISIRIQWSLFWENLWRSQWVISLWSGPNNSISRLLYWLCRGALVFVIGYSCMLYLTFPKRIRMILIHAGEQWMSWCEIHNLFITDWSKTVISGQK